MPRLQRRRHTRNRHRPRTHPRHQRAHHAARPLAFWLTLLLHAPIATGLRRTVTVVLRRPPPVPILAVLARSRALLLPHVCRVRCASGEVQVAVFGPVTALSFLRWLRVQSLGAGGEERGMNCLARRDAAAYDEGETRTRTMGARRRRRRGYRDKGCKADTAFAPRWAGS